MSDQGATGGDVWIVSATGGPPRNLTPGRPTSPAWMEWEDKDNFFVSELAGGDCQLIRLHLEGDPESQNVTKTVGSPIFSIPGRVGDGRLEMSLSSTADRSLICLPGEHVRPSGGDLCGQAGKRYGRGDGVQASVVALQRRRGAGVGQERVVELEERYVPGAGLADAAQRLRSGQEVSADCGGARRAGFGGGAALGRERRTERGGVFGAGLLCACSPIPAAALARARSLPRPTARTSATGTCATFWPGWTRWRRSIRWTPTAWA